MVLDSEGQPPPALETFNLVHPTAVPGVPNRAVVASLQRVTLFRVTWYHSFDSSAGLTWPGPTHKQVAGTPGTRRTFNVTTSSLKNRPRLQLSHRVTGIQSRVYAWPFLYRFHKASSVSSSRGHDSVAPYRPGGFAHDPDIWRIPLSSL